MFTKTYEGNVTTYLYTWIASGKDSKGRLSWRWRVLCGTKASGYIKDSWVYLNMLMIILTKRMLIMQVYTNEGVKGGTIAQHSSGE